VAVWSAVAASPSYAQSAADAHATEEAINCIAQRKCQAPTATPQPTSTPRAVPTATTAVATALPTVTATPAASPTLSAEPPCWTDDNGARWLLVDNAPYFDESGRPVACPASLVPDTDETPAVVDEAPFVQPTIFPTPTPVVQTVIQTVREIVREITVVHDATPQPLVTDVPTAMATEESTPTSTPTPSPTPTETVTATATETVAATPTARATPTTTPTPRPAVTPAESIEQIPPGPSPRPQQHLPPVSYYPDTAPSIRYLWPMPVLGPLVTMYTAMPPRSMPPSVVATGFIEDDADPYVYVGAKGYTRYTTVDDATLSSWSADSGIDVDAYLRDVRARAEAADIPIAMWFLL
jgi:hypothetical protein